MILHIKTDKDILDKRDTRILITTTGNQQYKSRKCYKKEVITQITAHAGYEKRVEMRILQPKIRFSE